MARDYENPKEYEEMQALRKQGRTYAAIAKLYNTSCGKVWVVCNREQHNANALESAKRWKARGGKALCDL